MVFSRHHRKNINLTPFSKYIGEIVYGASDGIVTTFAIVSVFVGMQNQTTIPTFSFVAILVFGIANLLADGISMAMGDFLSMRANQEVFKSEEKQEKDEIKHFPEEEKNETVKILLNKGYTIHEAKEMTELFSKNKRYWLEFMEQYEIKRPNIKNVNPYLTSLATFASFAGFGFIPLLPFILPLPSEDMFLYSIIGTFLALTILGVIRWKVTGDRLFQSLVEILLVGGVSATAAYLVGVFFKV